MSGLSDSMNAAAKADNTGDRYESVDDGTGWTDKSMQEEVSDVLGSHDGGR